MDAAMPGAGQVRDSRDAKPMQNGQFPDVSIEEAVEETIKRHCIDSRTCPPRQSETVFAGKVECEKRSTDGRSRDEKRNVASFGRIR
jgi:hypothetical protein